MTKQDWEELLKEFNQAEPSDADPSVYRRGCWSTAMRDALHDIIIAFAQEQVNPPAHSTNTNPAPSADTDPADRYRPSLHWSDLPSS